MNVQDAKDLHITEGDVRTIHDSSGKQLWGKLSYNTTYNGGIFQQTYSGANLYNVNDPYSTSATYPPIVDDDGWVTLSANNTGSSTVYVQYYSKRMNVTPDTDYAVVLELKSVKSNNLTSSSNNLNVTDSSNTQFSSPVFTLPFTEGSPTQPGTYVAILHTKADVYTSYGFRTFLTVAAGVDQEVTFRISLLADTSVTPETFVYQPYTGGIPAPNPDYPQPINVVTGTQTVTITGGNVSNNFTLNLGTLELCKIGSYQDYIYKSGDDWYVHKVTGSVTYDGSEGWTISTSGKRVSTPKPVDWASWGSSPSTYPDKGFCTHLLAGDTSVRTNDNVFNIGGANVFIRALNYGTAESTTADWITWLSSNNITIYSILGTPTDTQITDATLVGQLNAVHEWLTRYGYSSTVTGNLPIIINQTTLS